MNTYISIFPNTHPNISGSICIGADNIQAETKEDAIKISTNTVPYTWPFITYEQQYYDTIFHNAYNPDWNNADGYGTNIIMQQNFVGMGFIESFKTT